MKLLIYIESLWQRAPRVARLDNRKLLTGFALIELIVIIVVVSSIMAVAISNFSQIKPQFALSRVSYRFAQDIKRAQDMALSGVPYKDSKGKIKNVSGYGVYLDMDSLGNKRYSVYADKSPGNQKYDISDYLVETVDFSSDEPGIVIKEIHHIAGKKVSVNFNISNINTIITELNPGKSNVEFVFAIESDLEKTKMVLVNTSGLIEIK